jgi:hypothetical protein
MEWSDDHCLRDEPGVSGVGVVTVALACEGRCVNRTMEDCTIWVVVLSGCREANFVVEAVNINVTPVFERGSPRRYPSQCHIVRVKLNIALIPHGVDIMFAPVSVPQSHPCYTPRHPSYPLTCLHVFFT